MAIKYVTDDEKRSGQNVRKPEPSKLEKAWSALDRHVDKPLDVPAEKIERVRSAKDMKAKREAPISIRFPKEVLEYFQKDGPGWQRRINDVLLDYARKNSA